MANKYKRKSEPMNRWIALVMALISIFMGTAFSSTLYFNQPIDREDATELTCTYKDFTGYDRSRGGFTPIKLIFSDGSAQHIDPSCVNEKIFETIKGITPGTKFKMLVDPKNDHVLELVVNDEVIFDFEYAQEELERDGVGFFYLGLVMYGCAILFIVQAVLDFRKKIRRTKAKKTNK